MRYEVEVWPVSALQGVRDARGLPNFDSDPIRPSPDRGRGAKRENRKEKREKTAHKSRAVTFALAPLLSLLSLSYPHSYGTHEINQNADLPTSHLNDPTYPSASYRSAYHRSTPVLKAVSCRDPVPGLPNSLPSHTTPGKILHQSREGDNKLLQHEPLAVSISKSGVSSPLRGQYHQVGGTPLPPVLLHPTSPWPKVPGHLRRRPQAPITGISRDTTH